MGRSVPNTSNTFLATERDYSDFELELDFKVDDTRLNSGVQIRSHARSNGDGAQIYGYQVEIDPAPEMRMTAGIYYDAGDEHSGPGWLDELAATSRARNAFKPGKWNHGESSPTDGGFELGSMERRRRTLRTRPTRHSPRRAFLLYKSIQSATCRNLRKCVGETFS